MSKFARLEVVDGYQILFEIVRKDEGEDDDGYYVRIRRDLHTHTMLTYLGPYPDHSEPVLEHIMLSLDPEEFSGLMDSRTSTHTN